MWTRAYTCTLSSRLGDCGPSITLLGSFSAWLAELCRVKIYYVATAFAEFFLSGMLCGPVGSRCADPLCGPVVRTRCADPLWNAVRTRCADPLCGPVVGGLHRKSHKNDPKRVRGAVGFPFFSLPFSEAKMAIPKALQRASEATNWFRRNSKRLPRLRSGSEEDPKGFQSAPGGLRWGPEGLLERSEGLQRGP